VSTLPGFGVNSSGNAIQITGGGNISFTDTNRSSITGFDIGLSILGSGSGSVTVDVNGDVTGTVFNGIYAGNKVGGTSLTVTTRAGSSVVSANYGINARNHGSGALRVDANGEVTSDTLDGIFAVNFNYDSTADLTVTTGADSVINGARKGINASNFGTGAIRIEVNGDVTSSAGNGIEAATTESENTGGLTVKMGADSVINANGYGMYVYHRGDTGDLIVEANGIVTGNRYDGIKAGMFSDNNTGEFRVTTGSGSAITGDDYGIRALNYGKGALIVEANGDVTGNSYAGIRAINYNSDNTGGLKVRTGAGSAVDGGTFGISALNQGTGALIVEANGDVTSNGQEGIYARSSNADNASEFRVTTGAGSVVTGALYGISASSQGQSVLRVEANGVVKGGEAGIYAAASANTPSISISVGGVVQNTSGLASDMAIMASRAEVVLDNGGVITGTLLLSDLDDDFTNTNTWNVAEESNFGDGFDELQNDGLIKAGGTGDVPDATSFIDLELLRNSGAISMVDQGKHDGSNISDTLVVRGDFVGDGGTLAVDAFLGGPGSEADVLTLTEDVFGTTYVVINDTNDGLATFNPDGILVVAVEGPAVPSNFMLADGPVSNGLYSYDLVQEFDPIKTREVFLLKNFAGLHVFEVAAAVSGAQNIFFDTASAWSDRQDQLRDWQASRSQVVAVADPPLPEEGASNGLWLSVRGVNSEREASDTTEALGNRYTFDTGYDQTTFSVLGGADFGVDLDSGTLLFGALGGYFSSNQELNSSDTEIDYEGGSLGAYATYLNGGFFAGVLGKADFYTVDYDAAGPGDNSDTASGQNLGLRADAGYRFGLGGSMYLEPVASLAAVWTDIDDFALYDTTAEPGSNDALQLGGGARFGWEAAALDLSLTGRVWEVVNDGNDVGVIVPDTTLTSVTDTSFDGTFGEVTGKMGYSISERANVLFAGSYLFSDAQRTLTGTAGLSYSW
jgi:autotransporter family porin